MIPTGAIFLVALGVFILCCCAGISMILRASALRPKRVEIRSDPVQEPETDAQQMAARLSEIRSTRFAPPLVPVEFEPREPEDYKGPFRRGTNIRRTAKDRRYYKRRRDPEMFGRRGQPTDKEEVKEDGTGTRKEGR